jgi:secernin
VTSLIDQYGQGGRFEADSSVHYCGAFLIADKMEAWVVECAGKFWVAKQIKGNYMVLEIINNNFRQRRDKHFYYLKTYVASVF